MEKLRKRVLLLRVVLLSAAVGARHDIGVAVLDVAAAVESGTTDIVTLSCSYIPDIDTSKSLNTAYGAKDQPYLRLYRPQYGNSYIPDIVTPSSWDTGCHYIRGATVSISCLSPVACKCQMPVASIDDF
eukprot:scaffold1222_cov260-Chaetoceros_neogracile.AAC.54